MRSIEDKLRIDIAKPDIIEFFQKLPKKIFTQTEIEDLVRDNRKFWRLGALTTVIEFINYMLENSKLKVYTFEFPHRSLTRFSWGNVPLYGLVQSLKPGSYFTHYTAMYLHDLTEQIPKTIYLNFEQPPKRDREKNLAQERIDVAFKRAPRMSNNIAVYEDMKICILNGMHTGGLGVIERELEGEKIQVTDLERTLIDITVRPAYAGGVFQILNAYKSAKGKVSVNKLSAMLKKLNYIYPYHQAIGFYLERAGYKDSLVDLFRKWERIFDFYLTHQMKDTSYSSEWRLYFPKGF